MVYIVLLMAGDGKRMRERYHLPKQLLTVYKDKRVIDYVMDGLYWAKNVAGLGIVLPDDERAIMLGDYMYNNYGKQYHIMPCVQNLPGTMRALKSFLRKYDDVVDDHDWVLPVYTDTVTSDFPIGTLTDIPYRGHNWSVIAPRTNPDGDGAVLDFYNTYVEKIDTMPDTKHKTAMVLGHVSGSAKMMWNSTKASVEKEISGALKAFIGEQILKIVRPVFVDRMIDLGTPGRFEKARMFAERNHGDIFGRN